MSGDWRAERDQRALQAGGFGTPETPEASRRSPATTENRLTWRIRS